MKIIAFTGAGISRESGILTFAEQPKIRRKLTREYATKHPDTYRSLMDKLESACSRCYPNDAHYALADYGVSIITMNVDKLHQKAGSKDVMELHGEFPNPLLYDDDAPKYDDAIKCVNSMKSGDVLLVIGVSLHTEIACDLQEIAKSNGVDVHNINDNAAKKVRTYLKCNS